MATWTRFHFGELQLEGYSWAGDQTWFRVHPPGLALDAGRGALPLSGARDVFLTHGHLDHSLGVPFVLSQRTLHREAETRLFCPRGSAAALARLIAAAEELEGASYRYELKALQAGERVEVARNLSVEAFEVDHVVPSLGYHLFRRKRRLAPEYRHLDQTEIVALRRRGVDPSQEVEELWLSYCGDSGPGVFDLEPRLFTSRVLMLECTFLAAGHADRAARYRHLHLGDLEARAERFGNEALVLYHLSRRHRPAELRRAVEERLPALAERVHIVGEDP